MIQKLFFVVILFFSIVISSAQQKPDTLKNNWSAKFFYQNGYVFPTNSFLRGSNSEADTIDAFQAFSIKFSKQTTGEKLWEQLYKYPNYGFGVYIADFHNPEEIGVPFGIYGFFNAPFKRWKRWLFNYEIGFGASFNWKSFNPVTNKYNTAIGAGQAFLIDAGLSFQYFLTKRVVIDAGFSFTHFSNGALKKPNYGINTIAPKIGIRYNFYDTPVLKKQQVPQFDKRNEWLVTVFGGAKNVVFDTADVDIIERYEGVFFPVIGLSTTFNRHIGYKSKVGLGVSMSYNGALNAQIAFDGNELDPVDLPFVDNLQISIFPSYELVVHRFSLILQPSFYIYRKKIENQTPVFYQKIGVKYYITDKLFVGITLRDYDFHVSDFIQWNIGYRFSKN